jgi:hypothetical protein
MSNYYCINCGASRGFSGINAGTNLTGNQYQLEKYIKHTNPTAVYGINGTFDDPNAYLDYAVSASKYGFYEKDNQNRINLVWDANKRVGETIDPCGAITPNSAAKYVCPNTPSKTHGFPTGLSGTIICSDCGGIIKP